MAAVAGAGRASQTFKVRLHWEVNKSRRRLLVLSRLVAIRRWGDAFDPRELAVEIRYVVITNVEADLRNAFSGVH